MIQITGTVLFTLGFPVDFNLLNIKPQFNKFVIFEELVFWVLPMQLVSVFCFNHQVKCVSLGVVEGTLPVCARLIFMARGGFL